MTKFFKSDHVSWNSEVDRVSSIISKIHERDKTDHVAAHKEDTLTKIN